MTFCPAAVIFDMDGLLVDSEPVWNTTERAVIESRGRVHDPVRQNRSGLVGLRMDEFWTNMVVLYELEDAIPTLINEVVSRMTDRIAAEVHAHPGAAELIAFLQVHNIPMAIASSSPIVIIDTVVETKGWQSAFPIRVSGDEVARGKPAPDVYLEAARRLGVDPAHCLTLEDSVNGARAAVAAGMVCFAVPDRSHAQPEQFESITPDVMTSLFDALERLQPCFP